MCLMYSFMLALLPPFWGENCVFHCGMPCVKCMLTIQFVRKCETYLSNSYWPKSNTAGFRYHHYFNANGPYNENLYTNVHESVSILCADSIMLFLSIILFIVVITISYICIIHILSKSILYHYYLVNYLLPLQTRIYLYVNHLPICALG